MIDSNSDSRSYDPKKDSQNNFDPQSEIVLELKQASVAFAERVILDSVNLQIPRQESFVIIGPSGQGKTVLLKTLAGLISPTKGQALVCGQSWEDLRGESRQKMLKTMGMLFQKNALFDSLTCLENIAFPLREVSDLSETEILNRSLEFLEAVGIPQAKNLYPDEISGGMQKRLGIARALALSPEVVFYDDPTAGLDPITSRKIIELILRLKEEHKSTIVVITNDMNRAYQLADRIGMVVDKNLIITGNSAETKNHHNEKVRQFVGGRLTGPLTALA